MNAHPRTESGSLASSWPSNAPNSAPAQRLVLFDPDTPAVARRAGALQAGEPQAGELSPDWRLREYFERWFTPIVLVGERNASPATIALYVVAVDWWERLTSDPPLATIATRQQGRLLLAEFTARLRRATYRRGYTRAGDATGLARPLSEASVSRILRNLRAMLSRLGPERDDAKAYAELFDRAPRILAPRTPPQLPKPPFLLADARAIAAACELMPGPAAPGIPPAKWWSALVHLLYFTGLRVGTILQLEWSMLKSQAGPQGELHWLDVPARIVEKTGKPLRKPLHADCVAALAEIRGPRDLVLPWPHHRRHLQTMHAKLQTLAGLPGERIQSPHAWRRTHGVEMARVGALAAIATAQRSLDHADSRTTSQSYVNLEAELIAKLPRLLA